MRTILITGANQRLGYELTLGLKDDFNLILVSRSDNQMKGIQSSNELEIKKVDLMIEDNVKYLCKDLKEKNLIPDIVIHTVGGSLREDTQPPNLDVMGKTMRLNFGIAVQINTMLIEELVKKKEATVLFHVSSNATLNGKAKVGYVSAKSALNGYIKSSARYYAKYGVYFIGLLPGVFVHANNSWGKCKIDNPQIYQDKLRDNPFDNFFSAKDMADSIIPIVKSDNVAPFNGSLIKLDGGDL